MRLISRQEKARIKNSIQVRAKPSQENLTTSKETLLQTFYNKNKKKQL
jgi:hypothetical protein